MDKIQVISLQRSLQRKKDFIKNNFGLDYEFFAAVDGKSLKNDELNNNRHFVNPLPFPSLGAYGVALSHLKLWNKAIQNNKSVTIAEDDAIFRFDFKEKSSRINSMGGISPSVMVFSQEQLRNNIDNFKSNNSEVYPFKLDKCFGIPAYTISPKGAEIFKAQCFPMKNFELFFPLLNRKIQNTGIDIAMNSIYGKSKSYVSFPPLAVTKNEHEISTIQIK